MPQEKNKTKNKQTKEPNISIVEQMGVYVDNSVNFTRQVSSYPPPQILSFSFLTQMFWKVTNERKTNSECQDLIRSRVDLKQQLTLH